MQVESAPKVSVCVVTYNQEKYIGQCLQSLVDQKTDFPFEILVSDDCSTDGTAAIVKEFENKHPNVIRAFCHGKNMGGSDNYLFVHAQAVGEYIAHMDGDDYALPGKLQAQADILDEDLRCNLVWTPVLIETTPNVAHEQNNYFRKHALTRIYTRADLIKYGTVGTNSSKMYRRKAIKETLPPPMFEQIDYFVNVIQVGEGTARFTGSTPLGVYRMGIGIASSSNKTSLLTLKSIEYLACELPQHRLECNVAAAFRLLIDLKNWRSTLQESLRVFLITINWKSVFLVMVEFNFIRHLKLKK